MIKTSIPQLSSLTTVQKLELVGELWDEVLTNPDQIPATDWQKRFLDKCNQDYLRDPEDGRPWEEIRDELRAQMKAVETNRGGQP